VCMRVMCCMRVCSLCVCVCVCVCVRAHVEGRHSMTAQRLPRCPPHPPHPPPTHATTTPVTSPASLPALSAASHFASVSAMRLIASSTLRTSFFLIVRRLLCAWGV
jgi:hypothetical protein